MSHNETQSSSPFRPSRTVFAATVAGAVLAAGILMHWLDAPDEGWRRPGRHLGVLLHLAPADPPEEPERYAEGPAAMVTPLDLGVPEYPRSIRNVSTRNQSAKNSSAMAYYLSPDPPEQVVAFYRAKLGKEPGFVMNPQADRTLISLAHIGTTDFTLINIISDPNHPGGTFFAITHTPAPFPAIAP